MILCICYRLTCTENYFLSESLYVSEEQLINKKFVTLFTVTVEPQEWPTSPTLNSDSEDSDCSFNSSSTNQEDQKSTTRSCPLFFTEQKTPKNIPQQLGNEHFSSKTFNFFLIWFPISKILIQTIGCLLFTSKTNIKRCCEVSLTDKLPIISHCWNFNFLF